MNFVSENAISEMIECEVDAVNGGFWPAVAALCALAGAALASYEVGKSDGQCHVK